MRIFLIAISFTSIIFHCFVTIGVLKSAYQKNALPQRNFKGLRMKDFIGESSAIKSPCILFLTQSGCIACEKGREGLKKLGIINVELPVCSTPFQKDACLSMDLSESGSKATVVTPTFLVVNRKGVVVYQSSGWSDDHDSQTTFKHTLAEWMKD